MSGDDEDMYAIALGEHYNPSSATSTISSFASILASSTDRTSESNVSSNKVDHSSLFRQLLIGSRSQIEKLKTENEELKSNLKNAIDSGGVVICPNCTHHFKDRQCPMRPRAMKKMRARNMVELEFNNPDDLQTWLFLNQLETNNDGMPTVMNVKKTSQGAEFSLKSVGSLLPDLLEKKKEDKKFQDSEKAKRKKHLETRKSRSLERIEQEKSSDQRRDRKTAFEKINEKEDSSLNCNKPNNQERKKDNPRRMDGKHEHDDSRKSRSTITVAVRKERLEDETKKESENQHKDKKIELTKNTDIHQKLEISKRKLSPTKEDVRERKVSRQTIADRIQFFDKNMEIPSKSLKTLDSLIEKHEMNETTTSSMEKSLSQKTTTFRKPIVWNNSKVPENEFAEPMVEPKKAFEFKVKVIDKKKKMPPNADNDTQKTTACTIFEPTSKYKFVPTSKKNILKKNADEQVGSSLSTMSCKTDKIKSPTLNNNRLLETSRVTDWKLYSVKKTQAVLEHASKHNFERKNNPVSWSGKTIIINVEVQKINENTAPISESVIVRMESTEGKNSDSTYDEKSDQQRIADSMKRFGFSNEGIAVILKRQAENLKVSALKNLQHGSIQDQSDSASHISSIPSQSATSDRPARNDKNLTLVSENSKSNSSPIAKTIDLNVPIDHNVENYEDDGDVISEFFPHLANVKTHQALETRNAESSGRPISTTSFGSMVDREEDELTRLVREDSIVPPNGDCLMNLDDVDYEETITDGTEEVEEEEDNQRQKEDSIENSDWKDFCLEDLDEDLDDTERDRKISEMEHSDDDEREADEEMEWLETVEHEDEQDDSESVDDSPEHAESDIVTIETVGKEEQPMHQRSESKVLEMKSDFRLSDEEDLISPMTSTPRREEECPEDVSEPPDDDKDDINQPAKDDSFLDELDWNYGTDVEEEEQNEVDETEETKVETAEPAETENHSEVVLEKGHLEEGEISENEDVHAENFIEEKKKPIRERIQYIDEDRQRREAGHDDRRRSRNRDEDKERSRRSSSRRRSSKENRHRNYKQESRSDKYRSLLQRRNT
ncbi:hypothetical protein GCK72_002159 [Caenorhabditis remanei]|uniref:Uncharacterized protein n=1 Tax=Caenorhabditis remanei TaxID=31234 RepID=A0A6A5HSZ0_CAERE|nr:hypothetical protein GCK72_002159 [Caenorhabditis remanei]KAF1770341.1 hypothetical protein GCK72_002159 [Caenorhabditis remanei]